MGLRGLRRRRLNGTGTTNSFNFPLLGKFTLTVSHQRFLQVAPIFATMKLQLALCFLPACLAAVMPKGQTETRDLLRRYSSCAAAGTFPDCPQPHSSCPGGECVPFQGPHIGFWCCVGTLRVCWLLIAADSLAALSRNAYEGGAEQEERTGREACQIARHFRGWCRQQALRQV